MEIFRPLWALATTGAMASAFGAGRGDFSLTEYISSHRIELDSLLGRIRTIGGISSDTMDIVKARAAGRTDALSLSVRSMRNC